MRNPSEQIHHLQALTATLMKARSWVEHAIAPIRPLSPEAAAPGEALLKEIDILLAAYPAGQSDDDHERCEICDKPLIAGQRVMQDVELGTVHTDCCGPEREAYVKDVETGEPLGANDPIPQGYIYEALRGIADDYMTSEKHHPGYVLIPTEKFNQLRVASEALPQKLQCGAYPECGCRIEGECEVESAPDCVRTSPEHA